MSPLFNRPCRRCLCGLLACAALAGCATSPVLDRDFGMALRTARMQQTLHPDAGGNTATVAGMDGQAAASAYDNYQKSFAAPEKTSNALVIGVGK